MERTPVASSQIHSIGYDEISEILEVAFHNRNDLSTVIVYQYDDFPLETYEEFMAAESKGKFLNRVIKSGWGEKTRKVGIQPIEDSSETTGGDTATSGNAPGDVVQSEENGE